MSRIRFPFRHLAAAAALCAIGAAQATIVVSTATSLSAFQSATGGVLDGFNDLAGSLGCTNCDVGATSLARSVLQAGGMVNYSVSATNSSQAPSDLFLGAAAGNIALTTGWYTDTITFSGFNNLLAFGGNFFGVNDLGEVTGGGLTVTATDVAGLSVSKSLAGGSLSGFAGFISDVALASVTVQMTSPNTNVWASSDNVVLAVPEPSSIALIALGLGGLALRRRRA